jgi:hypothetical protein
LENFSVVRVKQDIARSTLGVLATSKHGQDTTSQAVGIDFNAPIAGPFLLTSQFAMTQNTGIAGLPWAGYLSAGGETGSYGAGVEMGRIGPDFRVEQGFIDAYDIDRQGVSAGAWKRFLHNKAFLQWVQLDGSYEAAQEIGGDLTLSSGSAEASMVTQSKWRLSLQGSDSYERYGDAEFTNRTARVEIESNVGGATGVVSYFSLGTLYDEPHKFLHFGFLAQPFRRVTVFPIFQTRKIGDTRWRWLTNTSVSYQATDRAFFRVYLQAESKTGSETQKSFTFEDISGLSANFLAGYEFAAGTMLYLVYNQQRVFHPGGTNHILVAKFTYSLRF